MGFWLRWFGILVGAISIFSLMQKLYGFGLAPVFKDLLGFYHAILHPVANAITSCLRWLLGLISITLPEIPADIVIVWVLIGSSFSRYIYKDQESDKEPDKSLINIILIYPTALVMWPGMLIIGILAFISLPDNQEQKDLFKLWGIEITKVVAAFLIIFAINAYSTPA